MGRVLIALLMAAGASGAVKDARELQAALATAKPGDTIVLRDGVWRDLTLEVKSPGVTLRAETPGKVVLVGSSSLTFAAPGVTVEGVVFRDGAGAIRFRSDRGRLVDSAIAGSVLFEASENSVERCRLEGKAHSAALVENAVKNASRNRVVESYFKDVTGSTEIFRILGGDASFMIERNLFEHVEGDISLESDRNRVALNTIREMQGGIANRSGNFNTVFGNVILCEGRKGAYGVRVTGQQTISTNYIERCEFGIMLSAGESVVEQNTVVDSAGADLILGGRNKVESNTFVRSAGGVSVEGTGQENVFSGNLVSGGEVKLRPMPTRGLTVWKTDRPNVPSARPLTPAQVGPLWSR